MPAAHLMTATSWHALPTEEVLARAGTSLEEGLAPEEAERRLAAEGPNLIARGRRRGWWAMLGSQLGDAMVLLLIAAAILSAVVGEPADTIAIIVIVLVNAALGVVQEYRAGRALEALSQMAAPSAQVRRGSVVERIPAAALVPGDLVLLEAGNVVPADLRLVRVARLGVDEAALTGESMPVDKLVSPLAPDVPVADRRNMAHQGTTVTTGRGAGVVTATGMRTELGRIAALLHGAEEVQTPLQRRLAAFARRIALAVIVICALVFGLGILRGEQPVRMFMTALSLAVAAVPEALPAVVTLALAFGARILARNRALVRRLPAVETLGSVTCICADKTGTLTENRMRVERLCGSGGVAIDEATLASPVAGRLLDALTLNNDAWISPSGVVLGDPTEVALSEAAAALGVTRAMREPLLPRVAELPFAAERGRMTTLHRGEEGLVAFTKGAPERVLPHCVDRATDDDPAPLDRAAVLASARQMASQGLRVLAFAMRRLDAIPGELEQVEDSLTFLGLAGLLDPPRAEAPDAVATCRAAGIRVMMITGDHPDTARAIAARVGIAGPEAPVLTGAELRHMPADVLASRLAEVRVFARVAPEDKIRLVRALQARGDFVAMTGDGVNDAPALRRADIGVAMGQGGTDVAREASAMVLLDDNFATIVRAVREGRRIYDNIRRFARYVLTGNSGEIWVLLLAPLIGLPMPLLPIHILWVNLLTDGLPGLALTAERAERDVMRRPPRPPGESLFAHGLWQHVVWAGLLIGGVTLGVQAWAWTTGDAHWQSMTFTTLTLAQMAHVMAIRSERESLFTQGVFSNRALVGAVALTFALQMATLYFAPLHAIFRTDTLTAGELAIAIGAAVLVFVGVEVEKWMVRRGWLYRKSS
ncbi:MAG TPA: cation-translocating P-type ATPase [Gemmatimonadaceae bacterium]